MARSIGHTSGAWSNVRRHADTAQGAAAHPVLPPLDDEDDSDGAAPSSAGVQCAPRGSLAQPIGSPPGAPNAGGGAPLPGEPTAVAPPLVVEGECVAVRQTPRQYFRRCAGCNEPIRSQSASQCDACARPTGRASAADDRRKRRAHRGTHTGATKILIDDGKLRGLRNTAFGQQGEAHAAAMRRDVGCLADAVIGPGHSLNRVVMDHVLDSYFCVVSHGDLRFVDDPAAGAAVTNVVPSMLASFYYSYGTQDADDNQLVMPPGGFYSDFLLRGVSMDAARRVNSAALRAAKVHCLRLCAVVDVTWTQLEVVFDDSFVPAISARVMSFLMNSELSRTCNADRARAALVAPRPGSREASMLLREFGDTSDVRTAVRRALEPRWHEYCVAAWPLHRGHDEDGRRRSAAVADFSKCTLPTRTLDMAVRRLQSTRAQHFLAGGKANWAHETRRGADVPADEPFSLHPALTNVRTADGGRSISAATLAQYSARIHYVLKRAFPALPNANEADVVVLAFRAAVRVMGTHAACEADAFWDERAMRLFQCVDIRWPRDLRVATAGMLAESTGFRRSEVYLLDRHDTVTNAAGVKVSLPRHKGDQESQTSANQVNHNARCPLVGVANWENFVCAETALPCANDRCAACMIVYHKQCMPYEADDDGPFFLHLPAKSPFSFDAEVFVVDGEEVCAPPAGFVKRAATYHSFGSDLKALAVRHNRIAEDRGWHPLDLVRAHFHAWRHGAITNAFFLGEDELAICLAYRVRDAKVMRHYICKKLGLLMPGNTSANLAGCATAQASTLGTMIAELRDSLIVSTAMSQRLPEPSEAQRASAAAACAASESHWGRRA